MAKNDFTCPHCLEQVSANRLSCPHCGSDATTGWQSEHFSSPDPILDAGDYDEIFEREFGKPFSKQKKNTFIGYFRIIIAVILIISMLWWAL
jgi:hypothetical protein